MKSLRARIIASFLLIVLITLVAAGAALYSRLGGYRDQLTAATLRQVASPVYYNLTFSAAARTGNDRAGLRLRTELTDYLRAQREESGIIVLLLNADGSVITEGISDPSLLNERFNVPPPPSKGPQFAQLPESKHRTQDGRTLLFVNVPMPAAIRVQPAGVAAIVVALPESDGPNVARDLRRQLLFAGMIGVVSALVVALVLSTQLYRPLGRVTAGVRAVARGDYRQRIPVSGPSEVQALANDVNTMADSVQSSQHALREFLANVSHELKTPLTSIRGFSQAMLDGTLDTPDEQARAARVIDVESKRLLQLVGELLDLSRIESGQQVMDVADVSARELVTHVRDVFALRAEDRSIALETTLEDDWLISADFDRVEQVLGNLIDNALRHTTDGGTIEIGVRATGRGFAELYVSDAGAGIAAEDLPHVFDRFYRSKSETAGSGAGLGLAISREIVRAHGGEIRAESHPGRTTFAFTLPLAANRGLGARPSAVEPPSRPQRLPEADTGN